MKFFIGNFLYLVLAAVVFTTAGCSTTLPESQRVARYRPQVEVRPVMQQAALASNVVGEVEVVNVPTNTGTAANQAAQTKLSPEPGVAKGDTPVKAAAEERTHNTLRSLKSGTRVIIHLRGIPKPEEINDVIDGWGEVTLPYIGEIKLIDKTVSEAERLIERSYIEGGIYKQINVIVVAEDEVYFVQGEVAKQGKYSLSGAVTLLQAISEAGGYTPFANRAKIKVMRGDQMLMYNAKDIARGKMPDPPIFADDIIEVLRRWM